MLPSLAICDGKALKIHGIIFLLNRGAKIFCYKSRIFLLQPYTIFTFYTWYTGSVELLIFINILILIFRTECHYNSPIMSPFQILWALISSYLVLSITCYFMHLNIHKVSILFLYLTHTLRFSPRELLLYTVYCVYLTPRRPIIYRVFTLCVKRWHENSKSQYCVQ